VTTGRVSHIPPVDGAGAGAGVVSAGGVEARAVRSFSSAGVERGGVAALARVSGGEATRLGRGADSRRGATAAGSAGAGTGGAGVTSGAITPSDSLTGSDVLSAGSPAGAVAGAVTATSAGAADWRAARYPPPAAAAMHPRARPPNTSLFNSMVFQGAPTHGEDTLLSDRL
jgi:hypothetical protein